MSLPNHSRGFTLLELLVVIALSGLILSGVASMVQFAVNSKTLLTSETEARTAMAHAFEQIGKAIRGTQDVLVPEPGATSSLLTRNVLAVSLDPTLDRNGDGYFDVDNDKDGLPDQGVRTFITGVLHVGTDAQPDMTKDGANGIKDIDDNGNGSTDERTGCWAWDSDYCNDEIGTDPNWSYRPTDWLDVAVFEVSNGILSMRVPAAKPGTNTYSSATWSSYVLARNVASFSAKRIPIDSSTAVQQLEVALCLDVIDENGTRRRESICGLRRWRVGGGS